MIPTLSVIVPTFKEAENIPRVVAALELALRGLEWEVLFVDDDSPDDTRAQLNLLARENKRVRSLWRVGRRGLASACVEGMLATQAPYIAVMDADLQHDERILPAMLDILAETDNELVIGSRYVTGGSTGELAPHRTRISRLATRLSRWITGRDVSDPMSGYFMLRRPLIERTVHHLYGEGFKILLDIITSAGKGLRFTELPYHMKSRQKGESKLDSSIALEFALLLLDKKLGGILPVRFAMFVMVGLSGVGVHMGTLYLLYRGLDLPFPLSQLLATLVAMTSNFYINNLFTYRDRRLSGTRLVRGLLSFYLACGLGAVLNLALAQFLFAHGVSWLPAGLAGAAIGAVWNYVMTSFFTWSSRPLFQVR